MTEGDHIINANLTPVTFGRGALDEVGAVARDLRMGSVLLMTDWHLAELEPVAWARASLERAGMRVELYDAVEVEPTDRSLAAAAAALSASGCDGVVSVGGGSVMDTAKAACLFASHPRSVPRLCQCADRPGQTAAGAASAAYRLPHHLRNRQ